MRINNVMLGKVMARAWKTMAREGPFAQTTAFTLRIQRAATAKRDASIERVSRQGSLGTSGTGPRLISF